MTIPKLTPYTGEVANPDGSQTQSEFTTNMFNQLSYEANLATELDATIDGMNNAVDEVSQNTAIAESSANAAEAAASSAGYQGLWPATGGSALKGETWQTQVSGTPTGEYYTALQNTTVDPVGDNVNWKVDVSDIVAGEIANAGDSQLAGGVIWPLSGNDSAKIGDTGLSNVSILIDSSTSPSTHYRASKVVSGEITELDFGSGTATVGGVGVTLSEDSTLLRVDSMELLKSIESARDGSRAVVASYHGGWAATAIGPKGGGEFVFTLGGIDDDGVVNFANQAGSWKRVNFHEIDITMCGARVDSSATDNDPLIANLINYCSTNKTGFTMLGVYQIDSTIDTTNVQFIKGGNRDVDGFEMSNSVGKTIIKWRRPTQIKNIRILGGIANRAIDDGSIGLDGFYFLNRAESIAIFGCGTGHKIHDAVSAFVDQITISGCHNAVELNGFEDNSAFSTTIGYSQATIQNNHNGIVGGSKGAFNTAVIGFNLHNTIFESNTNAGIIISDQEIGGVQYNSLDVRNLNFTGFVWFEANGNYAYVLDKCLDVSFNCPIRNEQNQPTIYPSSSRVVRRGAQDTRFGDDDQFGSFYRDGGNFALKGFASSNYPLLNMSTLGVNEDLTKASGFHQIRQDLDYSVSGRKTKHVWATVGDSDPIEASVKMTLSRNGNLTITGNYSPFTGVHYFKSKDYIATGMAVSGVDFTKESIEIDNGESIIVEGSVEITKVSDDKCCLGVVDFSERIGDAWVVHVAAVGDNSTQHSHGAVVTGDWEPGDFLSTTSDGRLKSYKGEDMRCVVMQSKGSRGGLAYGYFK